MAKTENILLDARHWLGWILSTLAVIGLFHLFGIHLHTTWYHITALFVTLVGVDVMKHKYGLQ